MKTFLVPVEYKTSLDTVRVQFHSVEWVDLQFQVAYVRNIIDASGMVGGTLKLNKLVIRPRLMSNLC